MASENETVEDIVREMLHANAVFGPDDSCQSMTRMERNITRAYAARIESAWRREKAELERKVREHHLAFLAERARHTDTYKDERIRAQDAEIATLKSELKPRRNCDTVADFHDAKRKFKDVNAKGPSNYCRRLCHWLLAPVSEGGGS